MGLTKESGTVISFLADPEMFEEVDYSAETLIQRLRETAFLTAGLHIVFTDERAGGEQVEFKYEGGIRDFVSHVNSAKDPIHKHVIYFEGDRRGRRGRGRDAVEPALRRVRLLVREQHQHHRGRLAPVRVQGRADDDAQRLRARQEPAQGEGRQPRRRGRPRRPRGGHLGQAPRAAVRGADEDEARKPVGARHGAGDRQRADWPSFWRRTRPRRTRSSRRRSRRHAPARRRARRATSLGGRARSTPPRFRASSPTARSRTPSRPSSSSSRGTPPAVQRSTAATVPSRRSSPCAAR